MDANEYCRLWQIKQRKLNTAYAQRVRASKRTEEYKVKRRKNRSTLENREKERLYQKKYRKRPRQILKNKIRYKARWALINGILVRPSRCEECGKLDEKRKDGKSSLRMDHYRGYSIQHALTVKFICITCDGKQLRKND